MLKQDHRRNAAGLRRAGRALAVALMIVGVLFPVVTASATAKTWDGSTSTDWTVTTNWSGDTVPVAGDTITIPDVTNDPILATTVNVASITIQSGGALTVNGAAILTVTGNITVDSGGTLTHTAGTIDLAGNLAVAGTGSFNSTAGVTFSGGAAQSISGNGATVAFGTLTVAKTAGTTLTLARAITVGTNLTVTTGILDLGANTATGGGAGTLSVAAAQTLKIGGTNTLPAGYATYTFPATSTVEYSGTTQAVSVETYGHLTISGTGTKTLAGSLTSVVGNLTVSGGTLDLLAFTATGGGTGTLTVGSGATLKTGAAFPTGYATNSLNAASTVEYSALGAQTISQKGYGNLTLSGSGVKTTTAAVTTSIAGNLTLSGATFADGGGATVQLNGAATQTISGADVTFNNLTVANSTAIGTPAVVLSSDVTVGGTLTLTSGRVSTGSNRLRANTLPITGGSASSFVDGNLRLVVANSPGVSETVVFPIGSGAGYSPVTITFPFGVTSAGGTLTFSTTAGLHPQIATSGLNATQGIARYWTGAALGLTAFSTYNATFNFVTGDYVGAPDTTALKVYRYDAGTWDKTASATSTATSATGTGFTSFSDFAVGNTGTGTCVDGAYNATVASGGTADTDCSNNGATSAATQLVETVLVKPAIMASGNVTISAAAAGAAPSGYTSFGNQVTITAAGSGATTASPMVVTFYIDSSVIPSGTTYATINVFKDSVATPVGACTVVGQAVPDPCVASRASGTGTDLGDAVITVNTSTASVWKFAVTGSCIDGAYNATVAAGGTADTDCSNNGATSAATQLVETVLVKPAIMASGNVTIASAATGTSPSGYTLFGREVTITAGTGATTASPMVVTFYIDSSVIPSGTTYATINVFKDSVATPVGACTVAGQAVPDPCVASRASGTGTDLGDAVITVYTSADHLWKFAKTGTTTVKCAGLTPTIVGTSAGETITGTAGNDVIWADAGNDTVYGLGGDDTICLGKGDDTAYGGDGVDKILGGGGIDAIHGDAGNDTLKGKGGTDTIYGDDGNDTIKGQGKADTLYGGAGDDRIYGNHGSDTLYGDAGADTLNGGPGSDTGYGGGGTDSCSLSTETTSSC